MRFKTDLPRSEGHVVYGIDLALGFWAEIHRPGKRRVPYDALHPGDFRFQRPLEGLLFFLVKHAVFSEESLSDALAHFEDRPPPRLSAGAKLAVEVVSNLKTAAAD